MDKYLFHQWFSKIFIPNCGRERPVVLLLDNHDSHLSTQVIDEAKANEVWKYAHDHTPTHNTHCTLRAPLHHCTQWLPFKDVMHHTNKHPVLFPCMLVSLMKFVVSQLIRMVMESNKKNTKLYGSCLHACMGEVRIGIYSVYFISSLLKENIHLIMHESHWNQCSMIIADHHNWISSPHYPPATTPGCGGVWGGKEEVQQHLHCSRSEEQQEQDGQTILSIGLVECSSTGGIAKSYEECIWTYWAVPLWSYHNGG